MKRVALIGSRKAPQNIQALARVIGKGFSNKGIVGYSGGAPGMDDAWMADYNPELSRIIIPWEGFNEHETSLGYYCWANQSNEAKIKSVVHAISVTGYFEQVKRGAQNLFSRNSMQILGLDCLEPVDAVYYWAPEVHMKVSGGTRVAVDIARKFGIPCYNLLHDNIRIPLEEEYAFKSDLDWLL